jgi:four helix bundle protein
VGAALRQLIWSHLVMDVPGPGRELHFSFTFAFTFTPGGAVARFDPEKMAAYRVARQHSRAIRGLLERADLRGYGDLAVQLRRSTASIPANLLEATGEWRDGKRLNYLMIAKGSTWESWAHTDTLVDFGLVEEVDIAEVRALQQRLSGLLIAIIRNLESGRGASATVAP